MSELRPELTGAHRVVVKIGSSSLTDRAGALDPVRLEALVDALAGLRRRGWTRCWSRPARWPPGCVRCA